jgi:hypothetical protein
MVIVYVGGSGGKYIIDIMVVLNITRDEPSHTNLAVAN